MVRKLKSCGIAWNQVFVSKILIFHQITKFVGRKCTRNQTLDMKWIKIALIYCPLILISSMEQKKVIFNVKYEIVLHTPYSKARCPPPKKRKSTQLACIEYRIRTCCNTDPKRSPIMGRIIFITSYMNFILVQKICFQKSFSGRWETWSSWNVLPF